MSEKRFILDSDFVKVTSQVVWDNQEEKGLTLMKLVDLLNEQEELIEELHISDHMGWGRAEKFEKELKQKKIYIKRLEYKVQKFKEENEQLRQTMQKVCELLEEEVDLFSDEATEHDVIAYCEMQDFDNKDAYYICIATKKAIQMLKGRDSDE